MSSILYFIVLYCIVFGFISFYFIYFIIYFYLLFLFYSDLLSTEVDGKTATLILSTIREEEQQTELLKRQTSTMVTIGAADAIDTNGVAAEQSFNREQVQEQEQVKIIVFLLFIYIYYTFH